MTDKHSCLLSRRAFLKGALGVALGSAISDQAVAETPAVQAARRRLIVDAQVHVWKAESPDWRWIPGSKPQMPEPFTIEKLLPLMDEAGVDRAVIIPPDWPGYRNDYALEAAKRYPSRFAVMGRIPLNPRSAALLPKWKEQPGMLGIRVEGWPTDGSADWFWPAAEKAGLPIMLLIDGRSAQVVRIAERHPQLTLIVDHMGVTADIVKAGKLADAINRTLSLARYPNVSVKLSAAPNYSTEDYPFRDFLPHIRRLFDAYGPQRCYWGERHYQRFQQGYLPATHCSFHRGAALPIRGGQGLDHGTRHCRASRLVLNHGSVDQSRGIQE
jgi:predicted TIM-barrel fold metal-dependent hydrolase